MSAFLDRMLYRVQHGIVRVSRRWHKLRPSGRPVSWVVGPVEIASMVANVARAIPDSYTVVIAPHPFYSFPYDFQLRAARGEWLRSRFVAPWVFGRLAATARGFLYVGADGILLNPDDRVWEFGFLKRHGVRVACLFTGSDIRSPVLMRQLQERTGLENIASYLPQLAPVLATAAYDDQRRRIAQAADRFADVIFTAAVDQLGYLTRPTEPYPYFFPDEELLFDDSKHAAPGPRVVVHAPSSPIIKGTQVVRAAVQRLKAEGYDFDYRELIGVPHDEVLSALREAHIVLNEFYAFVPGVFGVEAMANGCALLTRADETIETDLPAGSNDAWIVTSAGDIESNLRRLLDAPEQIAPQAAAGRDWVVAHATVSVSGARLRAVLDTAPASPEAR